MKKRLISMTILFSLVLTLMAGCKKTDIELGALTYPAEQPKPSPEQQEKQPLEIPKEVQDLTELIRRIRAERGITVLLIEHRLELVMSISDIIYVQNFGQTIAVGTPEEVQRNPEVITAYLGDEED